MTIPRTPDSLHYDSYRGLQQALEAPLGQRVDLVTGSGLKPCARAGVARGLIHVA